MPSTRAAGREYQPGDVLFAENDPADVMYVIQLGSVRITKKVDGASTTIAELGKGQLCGAVGPIRGGKRNVTATATTATRCLTIDGATLETMVTHDNKIALKVISGLAESLEATQQSLARIAYRDTKTRVCMAIIRYAEESTERREEAVWINKRLGDIGHEVAVNANELGELSKQFLRKKLLRVKRDGILIPDVTRLYAFLDSGDV